jgi:outer membrane protein assembly factor BamB
MGGAVIELGYAQPWEPEPEPHWPPHWPPRWLSGPPAWLVTVLVAAATLLTLGAAAPPRNWDPVLSQHDQNTALDFAADDTAYLTTQRTRSARLQAHRPGRPGALWTVNFPGGYPVLELDDDPSLLTLTVYDTDPDGAATGNVVEGRDPRTGRTVWSRPGSGMLALGSDIAVVTDRQEGGGSMPGPATFEQVGSGSEIVVLDPDDGSVVIQGTVGAARGLPDGHIEAVDRRTGRSRWTRAVAPDVLVGSEEAPAGRTRAGSPGRARRVVELALDGRLRLSDAATGETRHEVRLALVGRPLNVAVIGGVAVVHQQAPDGQPRVSVAYDVATGAVSWSRDSQAVAFCGERYLCDSGPGTLTVTDLASRTVRFHGRSDLFTINGDRLVVSWDAVRPQPAGTEVYDLRTGRRSHEYPGWLLASQQDGPGLLVQQMFGATMLVSTVAHDTGRVTVVGRASDWIGTASCTRGARYAGCVGPSGVRIWRLPRDG